MKMPIWKPLLVLAVIGLSAWVLWYKGLKPGIDLNGGTTLVYQVNLDPGVDAEQTINSIIEVYKNRIDPTNKKNMIWRRQGHDRIELQIPLAKADTRKLRDEFISARDALLQTNLSDAAITAAVNTGSIDELDVSVEQKDLLRQLRQAKLDLDAAAEEFKSANDLINEAVRERNELPADADEDRRQQANAQYQAVIDEMTPILDTYAQAKQRFETLRREVQAMNVNSSEVQAALDRPTKALTEKTFQEIRTGLRAMDADGPYLDELLARIKAGKNVSERDVMIARLLNQYPSHKDLIAQLVDKHTQYNAYRGALEDPEDIKALMRGSGVLEFRIAPNPSQVADLDAYRQQLRERGPFSTSANAPYKWVAVDEGYAETPTEQQAMRTDPENYFNAQGLIGQRYGDEVYVLLGNGEDNSITRSNRNWQLDANFSADERGFRAVGFNMKGAGPSLMQQLTGNHQGSPMAIVLDGQMISAPRINSTISSSGIITGGGGGFSPAEQAYLVRTLNAGALTAKVSSNPILENTTSPQFGEANLRAGFEAAKDAIIIIAIFMVLYYFFWGAVADFALFANVVIILGVMSLIDATFTLPGIAGIVLTIGMAVDANVLIFERIREEMERGADLRVSVRLGYEKALSTIIDANITTLITCIVLYYTATTEIKGFAQVLMIGVLSTMFTSIFCTRVIVDLFLDATNIRKLGMAATAFPAIGKAFTPTVDWVSKRYVFYALSFIAIIIGVVAIVQRGQDLLDIEFRGGTQVTFTLAQQKDAQGQPLDQRMTMTRAEVVEKLNEAAEKHKMPDLKDAAVIEIGNRDIEGSSEFSVITTYDDSDLVSNVIQETFQDVLDVDSAIEFADAQSNDHRHAPVYPIRSGNLGENIGRPELSEPVGQYLGGVAIVLDDLNPPASLERIERKIQRLRLSEENARLGYRTFRVIGMEPGQGMENNEPVFRSAVVVVSDEHTNYVENPAAFEVEDGLAATEWTLIREALTRDASLGTVTKISSQVSGEMQRQAVVAILLSLFAIVLYIWFRFGSLRYSFAAIVALAHDILLTLGILALAGMIYNSVGGVLGLSDFKINLAIVAALLTIIGYSLNDTIVIFDRIRETRGRLNRASPDMINYSVNQTLSRTLLTSTTTLLALVMLYIFGGPGVHGFAFAMFVGVLVGTYSSIAVASPLLLIGYDKENVREVNDAENAPAAPKPAR